MEKNVILFAYAAEIVITAYSTICLSIFNSDLYSHKNRIQTCVQQRAHGVRVRLELPVFYLDTRIAHRCKISNYERPFYDHLNNELWKTFFRIRHTEAVSPNGSFARENADLLPF